MLADWAQEWLNEKAAQGLTAASLYRYIYSHGFRHTAATKDVKSYTDREMMIRFGWSRPDMVAVYAHLTGRDVDEKDLRLHGIEVEVKT